ncbi:MAG: flagellar biosynthesis protein FlhB [Lachnospiraceae bacterium]|nr:flagellar biosynthesis protein FlhB [Lachnospiraceae bacterium]
MRVILNGRDASGCIQFHIYGDEDNDECLRGRYDVIPIDLQFFAENADGEEKTEPATAKKLEDARKEGQVAKSKEIANCLGLLTAFLVLKFWTGQMGTRFIGNFEFVYNRIPEIASLVGGTSPTAGLNNMIRQSMLTIVIILAPIMLIGFMVAFVSDLVQVKWQPTAKPLQPKFSKINPINGFKRIFSVNSLVELVKSLAKILLVVYVVYSYIKDKTGILYILYSVSLTEGVALVGKTVTDLGIRVSAIYVIIALLDFAYQKYKFNKDMKMTKQEIKEEYKNIEGNPEIKSRIRQRMREVSMRRMMQSVPKADVVITNPTHYAIAVQYDTDIAPAPVVLAKGADYLAQRIKDIAKDNEIEIVENKPLARMLYANVEVGEQVPPELYQAVAEVLAFVYHEQGKI